MDGVTVLAHFDGVHVQLDEPIELAPGDKLMVTVLPKPDVEDQDNWLTFSLLNLARAYGEDEPEYTLQMIKELNPDYERG